MTREEYDAIDAVNWSRLKVLGKSPAHYLHLLTSHEDDDTDARQRGRVLHLAIFEPEKYAREVVVYPEKRAGKAWDAFAEKHSGKEIITSRMSKVVTEMAASVRGAPMAAQFVSAGRPEKTVRWRYASPPIAHVEGFEFACKGRLDFVADCGAIVDLKSTRDASPTGFAKEVLRWEYHGQLAYYRDGYFAATGIDLPVVIVAVESLAPYVVQVYRVPEDVLELGRERYTQLLAHLNVCRRSATWPGYAEAPLELELPRWARPLDDEDDVDSELVFSE